jgi:hypothetical protein
VIYFLEHGVGKYRCGVVLDVVAREVSFEEHIDGVQASSPKPSCSFLHFIITPTGWPRYGQTFIARTCFPLYGIWTKSIHGRGEQCTPYPSRITYSPLAS